MTPIAGQGLDTNQTHPNFSMSQKVKVLLEAQNEAKI